MISRNDAERGAGAVILEDVLELAGKLGALGLKGQTTRVRRLRILVLDGKGAEQLTRQGIVVPELRLR